MQYEQNMKAHVHIEININKHIKQLHYKNKQVLCMDLLPSSSMPVGVRGAAGVRGAETTRAHSRAAAWLPFVAAGELVKEPDGAI